MAAKRESEGRSLHEVQRAVGSTATPKWCYREVTKNWLVEGGKWTLDCMISVD
jgi:hypothetical protein